MRPCAHPLSRRSEAPKAHPAARSDKPGEVVATAAAIGRTLKQAGADFHDLAAAIARTEPHDAIELADLGRHSCVRAGGLALQDNHQLAAIALGAELRRLDPGADAVSAVEQALAEADSHPRPLHPKVLGVAVVSRPASYRASPIKRHRATKAEVEDRREALFAIIETMHPMTVRQVFYQATVRGLVEKTEAGYAKVQTDLVRLRRIGAMPYDWLADNTRWQRKLRTFSSSKEALEATARLYRKSLWDPADAYVEIWLEKDALSGVILPITSLYDVPLMVARGYASLSFLHSAAEFLATLDVPAFIYHLGVFDPSGVNAGEKIEETLQEMAPDAEIFFERLDVLHAQIEDWRLPMRPTKKTDSRAKGFGDISVELDAISPDNLRALVEGAIQKHLPPKQFAILKQAEESERILINGLVGMLEEGL